MRIAIVPFSSLRKYERNSMFLVLKDFVEYCEKNFPSFFYWYLPEYMSGLKEKFGDKHRFFYYEPAKNYFDSFYLFNNIEFFKLFNRLSGKYPVDVVLTNSPTASFFLLRLMSDLRRSGRVKPDVFAFEPTVRETKLIGRTFATELDDFIKAVGYTNSNPVFLTNAEFDFGKKMVIDILNPASALKMLKNKIVCQLAVRTDILEELKDIKKNEKITLFFGGRLNNAKRIKEILKTYDNLFRFGRDLNIVITTSFISAGGEFDVKDYPEIDFKFGMGRKEYLKEAAKSHILFIASPEEGFPVGFFEQVYLGLVPILPDRPWARASFPEDYPYFYKNDNEAQGMIRYVYDNYDKAKAEVEKLKSFIKSNYSEEKLFAEFYKSISSILSTKEANYTKLGKGNVELIKEAINELGSEFSFEQLLGKMKDRSKTFRLPETIRSKSFSVYEIYKNVLLLGYKDKHNEEMPIFQKI